MGVCVPQPPADSNVGVASDAVPQHVLNSDGYQAELLGVGSKGHQLQSESAYEQPHAPIVNLFPRRHTTGSDATDHISAASPEDREVVRHPITNPPRPACLSKDAQLGALDPSDASPALQSRTSSAL